MGRLVVHIILPVFITIVLIVVVGASWWGHDKFVSAGPLKRPVTVMIPKGSGLETIAGLLQDNGVVAGATARIIFTIGARLTNRARRMQAGEYEFPAGISMASTLELLVEGRTVKHKLTVAEGLTTQQVLTLIAATDGLTGPMPPTPDEGALLPETYYYSYGDTRAELLTRMGKAMEEFLSTAWAERTTDITLKSRDEALILASIIEKETGRAGEHEHISAVFHNRLRRGMRLQSDPTVSYAITGPVGILGRALTRVDLKTASPYNTYHVYGLPPTPITNPGRVSIIAALHPLKSDDLFFVADGTGGHAFARSLAQHNRNVAKWRRIKHRTSEER